MDGITAASDRVDEGRFDPASIRSMIDQVSEMPIFRTYRLTAHEGTMQLTVMPEAWRGAGRKEDDPGEVGQYYFEDHDLLVIDLQRR